MVATSALKTKNLECVSDLVDAVKSPQVSESSYWDILVSTPTLQEATVEYKNICNRLVKLLEASLSNSKRPELPFTKLFVPEKLTRRIAEDVLRLSFSEPCGLRGCVILIMLEAGNLCKKLDTVVFDSSVAPTFELILVLKRDGGTWPKLRDFVLKRTGFLFGFRRVLTLVPSFRLMKRKLYSSSAGMVLEEYSLV
ncbi:DNA damage-inducible transcript 4-like protein [Lissotriton helveticus]